MREHRRTENELIFLGQNRCIVNPVKAGNCKMRGAAAPRQIRSSLSRNTPNWKLFFCYRNIGRSSSGNCNPAIGIAVEDTIKRPPMFPPHIFGVLRWLRYRIHV